MAHDDTACNQHAGVHIISSVYLMPVRVSSSTEPSRQCFSQGGDSGVMEPLCVGEQSALVYPHIHPSDFDFLFPQSLE